MSAGWAEWVSVVILSAALPALAFFGWSVVVGLAVPSLRNSSPASLAVLLPILPSVSAVVAPKEVVGVADVSATTGEHVETVTAS
jgi:hypothetical protein